VLEEGITEADPMASFTAAGTSYATARRAMLPSTSFYSMFGFQRTMDQIWAFGDGAAGIPARRDRRAHHAHGEGLQHETGTATCSRRQCEHPRL